MKKFIGILTSSIVTIFLFAGIATAHVSVLPTEAVEGSYQVFTVRVPTEKDTPTTKIEVKIPSEVDISRFEPKTGWKYDLTKDSSGKITSVAWTATGEGLTATEFGQFNMNGKVANGAKEISWKAYQTYKDGSVVEWVGAADSDKPASVTKVNPKPAGAPAEGHGSATAPNPSTTAPEKTSNNVPMYASIAALVVSLLSLVLSLKKKG